MATVMESFECPSGFKEEEVMGQLCLEDLDENSELWLIRMPSDVELSVVDRKKIFLCDTSTPISVQSENGKVLECFAENCEIPNLCVVLPQKSDKRLHEVKKKFQGSIIISEGFNLCDETKVMCEIGKESMVNTISNSLGSPHKGKKKKSSKTLENLNYETEIAQNMDTSTKEYSRSKKRSGEKTSNTEVKDEPLSPQLKERRKKSSTTLDDANYETEDSERINTSYTKKHSRSKKRSGKRSATEVKEEPDWDEFPLCNSQV